MLMLTQTGPWPSGPGAGFLYRRFLRALRRKFRIFSARVDISKEEAFGQVWVGNENIVFVTCGI